VRLCGLQMAQQRFAMDVVREDPLAVELDDRQPFAVARLKLRIAADVDLDELERARRAHLAENGARPLAEVAAGGGVERDPRYG
jgi:hypothetical protein